MVFYQPDFCYITLGNGLRFFSNILPKILTQVGSLGMTGSMMLCEFNKAPLMFATKALLGGECGMYLRISMSLAVNCINRMM